jgi:hypothetical protein
MKNEFEIFENSPIQRMSKDYKLNKILKRFPNNVKEDILEEKHIMLWFFVDKIPFKYIKLEAYNKLVTLLFDNSEIAINSILEHGFDLTKAILTFNNKHNIFNNEDSISDLSSENIYNFDTIYHLEYIKNTEHVYGRLIRIVISILGKIKEKNYFLHENMSNMLDILQSNNLELMADCINTTVRNAISHGAVYYETNEIVFYDKKNEIRLFPFEYIRMLDDLSDTCAALLLAFVVFILNNNKILSSPDIPDGIIFIYLSSLLGYKHFEYINILPFNLAENKKQIVFYNKTNNNSSNWQFFESMKLAYFLNTRFNHKFSRIVINIDSGKSLSPAIFIDLNKLNDAIKNNSFAEIGNSVDASLLWYNESNLKSKIWFYKNYNSYNWEESKQNFLKDYYSRIGKIYYGDKYIIKKIEDRSCEKTGRIFLHVALNNNIDDLFSDIENFIDMLLYIIKIHKKSRKLKVFSELNERQKKVKPIYIWGSIYKQNTRTRNLHYNNNKICDFEWIRNCRKYKPILLKNSNEIKGIRIRFNEKLFING